MSAQRFFGFVLCALLCAATSACNSPAPVTALPTATLVPASPTTEFFSTPASLSNPILVPASVIVLEPTPGPMVNANVVSGKDIAENGAGGAVGACNDCHGADGAGDELTATPRLANLQATYLYNQLAAYQTGARKNLTMRSVAAGMNPSQMRDTAAYYASLPIPATEPVTTDVATRALGEELFLFGKKLAWDKWLPACRTCHGRNGNGAGELFPPLAGQRASYLRQTLREWQSGARAGDPNALMKTIALQLTPDEMDAAATYFNNMETPK